MKFSQIERGINNFSVASRGDQKFNRVFHQVSTTPPRELKNDNSLISKTGKNTATRVRCFMFNPPYQASGGGGGGLKGPDDQTHTCQSETSYSMISKLGDF